MNILLALAIPFAGAFLLWVPATPAPVVSHVNSGGAAEIAGLQVGDRCIFQRNDNPKWEKDAPVMRFNLRINRCASD